MRALTFTAYKRPLQETTAPEPAVGDHDVLVKVQAAGLNQLDEKIRTGEFKQFLHYSFPLTLGHDMAGTVIQIGALVRQFSIGDEVYARPRDGRIGTFAERISVHEDDVALRPTSINIVEAGSLPLVALTAWQALVERANVQPGQKVLIHAGAGGVGSIAIQLAKHLGATVARFAANSYANEVLRMSGSGYAVMSAAPYLLTTASNRAEPTKPPARRGWVRFSATQEARSSPHHAHAVRAGAI